MDRLASTWLQALAQKKLLLLQKGRHHSEFVADAALAMSALPQQVLGLQPLRHSSLLRFEVHVFFQYVLESAAPFLSWGSLYIPYSAASGYICLLIVFSFSALLA